MRDARGPKMRSGSMTYLPALPFLAPTLHCVEATPPMILPTMARNQGFSLNAWRNSRSFAFAGAPRLTVLYDAIGILPVMRESAAFATFVRKFISISRGEAGLERAHSSAISERSSSGSIRQVETFFGRIHVVHACVLVLAVEALDHGAPDLVVFDGPDVVGQQPRSLHSAELEALRVHLQEASDHVADAGAVVHRSSAQRVGRIVLAHETLELGHHHRPRSPVDLQEGHDACWLTVVAQHNDLRVVLLASPVRAERVEPTLVRLLDDDALSDATVIT